MSADGRPRGRKIDQHWKNGVPVETIVYSDDREIPYIDDLNEPFPRDTWEEGPYGPKPPWQRNYVIYLLDPLSGATYTAINSTIGQLRAFEALRDRISLTRRLVANMSRRVVKLSSAMMKTRYGLKERPEFQVLRWHNLSPCAEPTMIAPPTSAEVIDDDIPF